MLDGSGKYLKLLQTLLPAISPYLPTAEQRIFQEDGVNVRRYMPLSGCLWGEFNTLYFF